MSNSLRDQLLGLGYKPVARTDDKPKPKRPDKAEAKPAHRQAPSPPRKYDGGPGSHRPPRPAARTQEEIDLAKAYALRATKEKDERIAAEKLKQETARLKREAKAR